MPEERTTLFWHVSFPPRSRFFPAVAATILSCPLNGFSLPNECCRPVISALLNGKTIYFAEENNLFC
jgi:hypothetical protein